ncbi:hypothetical protein C2S51_034896 [Perilla frutescens var. frutescens]|nr:hypothetical protein C2S51_034896 [Perilla frutescens var. frutescens]
MEGLIPFLYRAIIQYRNGGEGLIGSTWLHDSPPASYVRLPGDSGRFSISGIEVSRPGCGCSTPSSAAEEDSFAVLQLTSSCHGIECD